MSTGIRTSHVVVGAGLVVPCPSVHTQRAQIATANTNASARLRALAIPTKMKTVRLRAKTVLLGPSNRNQVSHGVFCQPVHMLMD